MAAEGMFHATVPRAAHRHDAARRSATSSPTTLAIMHGSSFQGDGEQALYDLAAGYEKLIAAA